MVHLKHALLAGLMVGTADAKAQSLTLGASSVAGGVPAQPPVVATTDATSCPTFPTLSRGIYLRTRPHSLFREVDIYGPDPNAVTTTPPPGAVTVAPTTPPPGAPKGDVKIGSIKAVPISWTTQYELRDIHDNVVSKIVNPGWFWDTSQEIYDCKNNKLGHVTYEYDFKKTFLNRYAKHAIYDGDGAKVANLVQDEQQTNNFFSAHQYEIYARDLQGNPLVSMKHPRGGFTFGTFTESFDVQIDVLPGATTSLPPTTHSEFLLLVFADALSMDARFGPFWTFLVPLIVFLLCCFSGCCLQRNTRASKDQYESAKSKAAEEKESLLATIRATQEQAQPKSTWGCCSRRVVAPGH